MTELDIEIQYRLQERLGILCGAEEPTPLEIKIALEEIEQYKKNHDSNTEVQPARRGYAPLRRDPRHRVPYGS